MRGVTKALRAKSYCFEISTHTPRAGSDAYQDKHRAGENISTHTPRAGSDQHKQ